MSVLPSPTTSPQVAPPSAPLAPGNSGPELAALLGRARGRVILLRVLAGFGLGLALAAVALVLTCAFLGVAPFAAVRDLGLGVAVAALLLAPLLAGISAARQSESEVAGQLTALDPRLRSVLLSALELRDVPELRGLSVGLIRAQAAYAAASLRDVEPTQAIGPGPAYPALALGLSCVVFGVAAVAAGPEPLQKGFQALRTPVSFAARPATKEPITGDIELTLFYPPHTKLAPRTLAGSNGQIEAPAGTEVRLRTRADRPVKEAAMVVNGDVVPLTVEGGRELAGKFTVKNAGSYFFRFGPQAHPVAEGPPIPIGVRVDAPPEVTLTAPPETLEVDPAQVLTLRYRASDDYGLTELKLAYRLPGSDAERTLPIKTFEDPPRRDEGTARFDLGPLHLGAGDQLTFVLEGVDNDQVAGPKIGRSRPHLLKVFSEVEHHREVMAQVRALWERLLLTLGDRLEESAAPKPIPGAEAADTRALTLCMEMDREASEFLRRKDQDRRVGVALANTAHRERRMASATADARESVSDNPRVSRAAESEASTIFHRTLLEETEELERDVLYLEGLLDQASRDDLRALSKEIASRRRELSNLVDRYRKHPTAELKEEIQAQIARLRSRMAELMNRGSELAKGISDQHLNREALSALQKGESMDQSLAKAEKALNDGDLDGALKSLDQMAQAIDRMQNQLEKAKSGQADAHPGLAQKLSELKNQLSDVERREEKIAEDTQALERAARKAAAEQSPVSPKLIEQLKADAEKAKAELAHVPENVSRRDAANVELAKARDRVDQLSKALQAMDLDEARRSSAEALENTQRLGAEVAMERAFAQGLHAEAPDEAPSQPSGQPSGDDHTPLSEADQHLKTAEPLLRAVRTQLEKLFPDERSVLTPQQQSQLSQLQKDQQKNREDTQKLSQKLEQVGKEAPIFDPAASEALDEAGDHMEAAKEQMSNRAPGRAGEEAGNAVRQLKRLGDAMQKGGQGQDGMPNPFALAAPQSDPEQGDGDGADQSHEPVVVPGADQYQVPAEFRRDILDAMRKKAPDAYEDQVKHYYQEIVK